MLRVAARVAVIAGLACSACLHDDLVPCGAKLCPSRDVCTSALQCVDPESAAACEGKAEGEPCTLGGDAGTCWQGGCHRVGCGNGILDQGEVCDDGNNALGDGCSADCLSDETCGNGTPDPIKLEQCDSGIAGQSRDGCSSSCTLEVEIWRDVSPAGLAPAANTAMVFDDRRGVSVLYGGIGAGLSGETWEWEGNSWRHRRLPVTPGPLIYPALAFDQARHRTVLFGGGNIFGVAYDATWEYDGIQWMKQSPTVIPPARTDAAIAYDPIRHRTVMFGGGGAAGVLGDTWEWDGTSWTQVQLTPSPSSRTGARLAFDPTLKKLVLFGGLDGAAATHNDTWTFDGAAWTLRNPAGKPSVRFGAAMATCNSQIVVFGGRDAAFGTALGDGYTWNGSTWTLLGGSAPAARTEMGFAYDGVRDRCVLYGGSDGSKSLADLWELAGATWTAIPFLERPKSHADHGFAYDPLRGRTVLFAGKTGGGASSETWEWDGENWLAQAPAASPPPRSTAVLAYDERLRAVVVFGGGTGAAGNDLWAWDGSTWSALPATTRPSGRTQLALTYDRDRDRLVMYGGFTSSAAVLGDTWEWDGTTWTDVSPTTGPGPRRNAVLAYDPRRKRTVLFGGSDDPSLIVSKAEVWEWDGTAWTPITTTTMPIPASRLGVAFDPPRRVLVGFGGTSFFGSVADVSFEYAGTIDPRTPAVRPTARGGAALAYDTIAHRSVLFGGDNPNSSNLVDTWARAFEEPLHPPEACRDAGEDTDGDSLAGCADPDCQGRCNPLCPPGVTCAANAPHCGDGACGAVEDYLICPSDCAPP